MKVKMESLGERYASATVVLGRHHVVGIGGKGIDGKYPGKFYYAYYL